MLPYPSHASPAPRRHARPARSAAVKAQSGGDAADKGWLASHIPAAFGSASALLNSITMIIATELGACGARDSVREC